jgi:hypothetical protein
VRFVLVADLPPTEVHLGCERGRRSRLIDDFVAIARELTATDA